MARRHQRQRVHVHRDRPVAVGLLQCDAHQAVGALLQALLRDGRAQHVTQQRLAPRRIQRSRTSGRVQREPVERDAQRLVVGERVRLERREAPHPLRPGGWRLARDRRGGEVALGVASGVRIGAVLLDPQQAAAVKVPLDAPEGALEHGADLACLEVTEPLPAQLAALLVPGAVERDKVQCCSARWS